MHWHILSSDIPENYSQVEKVLLDNRKITDAQHFFSPPSPLDISLADVGIDEKQMVKAVARILAVKERQEDVLIFGDYDADGICATGTLWEALKSVGIIARPFIPHREKHGYGLSLRSVAAVLAEKKPDLLISVDNGIVAHEAFAELRRQGISTILTDHHHPEATLPDADILVHTTQVCGTGVAWFLARSLNMRAAANALDLAAIATVTDQMPLQGINRAFVWHGLKTLARTKRVGLQKLMEKADVDVAKLDTNTINYAIGPRMNAMGRLKHGLDVLRLLCTKNPQRAEELVNELQTTNTARQEVTSTMVEQALRQSQTWETEHLIIVSSTEYHEGVIGLLAGKLMETFYKPAIAIALGDKVAKASARSVAGVNITDLIRLIKADLLEVGGHPLAAGFGFLPEKLEMITAKLLALAKEQIPAEMLQPHVDVECLLPFNLLNLDLCSELQKFAPFGQQNREPIFGWQNLQVVSANAIGKEGKHLKMGVLPMDADHSQKPITCLGWGMGGRVAELSQSATINLAGTVGCNEWKNRQTVQVVVKDIKI